MLKLVHIAIGIGAIGASLVTARLAVQRPEGGTTGSAGRTEHVYDERASGSGARGIEIEAPIAQIDLETGNYSDVSVHAVRWTKTPDSPGGKHWMNDAHFSVSRSGDVVTVKDEIPSDHGRHGIEGNFNGGMEIHVKAPASMNLKVQLGVGSVKPRGDLKSVDIHVGAGDVEGQCGIGGSSDVHVGAGKVEMALPRSENLDVDAHTGVGEIKGLPGSRSRSGLHIGDSRSGRFGSGGSSLSIHVGAGSIQIDSPSEAKSLSRDGSVSESEGARDQKLWSDDKDSDDAMDHMDIDIPDVGPIVENALAMSGDIVAQTKSGKHHGDDDDFANIGPAIEEAMKSIGPTLDKTLSQIGPEIDRAMRQAKPEMDRNFAKLGPELQREMQKIRPEIERARREARQSLSKSLPDMEKAMKQAQAEIDKASRDFDRSKNDKELSESIRHAVREALKAAHDAMRQSMEDARKAIREATKDLDTDKG